MTSAPATALSEVQPVGCAATGRCLCGAVRYSIQGALMAGTACHCGMCRRHHGALGAFTGALVTAYRIDGAEHVEWYRSSPEAERGFCRQCGSKLFWRQVDGDRLDVTMGSLDQPTGLQLGAHIWIDHRGDYYDIADALPKYAESALGEGERRPVQAPASAPPPSVPQGGCLCGAVRFEVTGPMRDVVVCHCSQCLHWHGHAPAYSAAKVADVKVAGEAALTWYRSSETGRRGFCRHCGSSLFWQALSDDKPTVSMAICAGALDGPTGLKSVRHVFTADKPDYYDISDKAECLPHSMSANPIPF
ncbi:MAG: GFA family protein [Dongiaceae bacterium]